MLDTLTSKIPLPAGIAFFKIPSDHLAVPTGFVIHQSIYMRSTWNQQDEKPV